jgi:hypothetical protein
MIVLADRGEEQKVIEEERQDWLIEVLAALDVPPKAFELDEMELVQYLNSLEIEVWYNSDGTLDIYKNDEIIGQWKSPELFLIKDSPMYYEIHINAWARPLEDNI